MTQKMRLPTVSTHARARHTVRVITRSTRFRRATGPTSWGRHTLTCHGRSSLRETHRLSGSALWPSEVSVREWQNRA